MHLIKKESVHAVPNGMFALKGGQLNGEIKDLPRHLITEKHPLSNYFKEAYFEEKYLLYVQ
jgi:16S rRNA (guanine527-N7)-methyltransferase